MCSIPLPFMFTFQAPPPTGRLRPAEHGDSTQLPRGQKVPSFSSNLAGEQKQTLLQRIRAMTCFPASCSRVLSCSILDSPRTHWRSSLPTAAFQDATFAPKGAPAYFPPPPMPGLGVRPLAQQGVQVQGLGAMGAPRPLLSPLVGRPAGLAQPAGGVLASPVGQAAGQARVAVPPAASAQLSKVPQGTAMVAAGAGGVSWGHTGVPRPAAAAPPIGAAVAVAAPPPAAATVVPSAAPAAAVGGTAAQQSGAQGSTAQGAPTPGAAAAPAAGGAAADASAGSLHQAPSSLSAPR